MTLEEEAREYEKHLKARLSSEELASAIIYFVNNSKWVQAEKIKAQIDCWEKALKIIPREDEDRILLLVDKLKQQLKELEEY